MASFSSAVFAVLLFLLHVSSLVHGRLIPADAKMSLDGRGHFMLHKKSMDYNPVARGNAVSIAGGRSYIPGGDESKMFMLHKKSLHYNPVAGGDDTLAASKMSLDGRGPFMHPEKPLFYNPIVGSPQGGNAVIPSGDDTLAARWSESPPPPSVVIESEPPSKPRPPTCLPRC